MKHIFSSGTDLIHTLALVYRDKNTYVPVVATYVYVAILMLVGNMQHAQVYS